VLFRAIGKGGGEVHVSKHYEKCPLTGKRRNQTIEHSFGGVRRLTSRLAGGVLTWSGARIVLNPQRLD